MEGILLLIGEVCGGVGPIVGVIKNGVFPIFQIGIPILLILMGSIDLGKAVISSDDKAIKESTSKLIKRCIAAIAIFFVVTIVKLLMNIIATNAKDEGGNQAQGTGEATDWAKCWDQY